MSPPTISGGGIIFSGRTPGPLRPISRDEIKFLYLMEGVQ